MNAFICSTNPLGLVLDHGSRGIYIMYKLLNLSKIFVDHFLRYLQSIERHHKDEPMMNDHNYHGLSFRFGITLSKIKSQVADRLSQRLDIHRLIIGEPMPRGLNSCVLDQTTSIRNETGCCARYVRINLIINFDARFNLINLLDTSGFQQG